MIILYNVLQILKDVVTRHKLLQGCRIHYIPGWDCHGLPIELKALDGHTNLSAVTIWRKGCYRLC